MNEPITESVHTASKGVPSSFMNNVLFYNQYDFVDPRSMDFVRGRSTNLALSTRGIEALKAAGVLEYVSVIQSWVHIQ